MTEAKAREIVAEAMQRGSLWIDQRSNEKGRDISEIVGFAAAADSILTALREAGLAIVPVDLAFDELRNLVLRQAEDEGLWFVARTAPEAYLQQELRRLHAAIEREPLT